MGVRERLRQVLGDPLETEGAAANPGDGAPAGGGAESVPPIASVAKEAKKAGARVKKIDLERQRVETAQELDELFQPEQWEELCNIYPDLRFVMTGWAGFRLTEIESKRMAVVTARCMRVLLKIDPAYIAVVLFFMNYGMMITKKEAAFAEMKRREKEAQRQEKLRSQG